MELEKSINESKWQVLSNRDREPRIPKPIIINEEILLDNKVLLSITNPKGIITYCNDDFVSVSGYDEWELAGSAHNIIRHPDMPRVIFKFMWSRIQSKNNIIVIVKNLSKSGKYYWVMTDFVIKEDELGNITGYKAYRKPAPRKAIEFVIPFYEKLRKIEEVKGMSAAEEYMVGYLEAKETTYDDFIENLIINNISEDTSEVSTKTEKRSFFKRLFGY